MGSEMCIRDSQNECQEVPGSLSGAILAPFLKPFSDVFSEPCFQRMHREKLKESEREAPTSNGRARARSARARAHPRLSRLAGLQLGMLWLLLRSCCSRCLCSCSSSSPLLFRLLLRLQCLTLSRLSRFPFHDSQVSENSAPVCMAVGFSHRRVPQCRLPSGRPPGSHLGAILGAILEPFWDPRRAQERQESPRRAKRGPK